jgi:hypothetical protein
MAIPKIAFGVLALGLGALGSSFIAKPLITAGWYSVDPNTYTTSNVPSTYNSNFDGPLASQPQPGTITQHNVCLSDATYICAVEFTSGGARVAYVTGDYQP